MLVPYLVNTCLRKHVAQELREQNHQLPLNNQTAMQLKVHPLKVVEKVLDYNDVSII